MNTQDKIQKIIDYIDEHEQAEGYYGYKDKEFHVLGKLSYCCESLFYKKDEIKDFEDILRLIEENGIWETEVIYPQPAYKYVWEVGLLEAQEICNEYGIDQPLFHIEQVATACLQRRLNDQLYEMQDELKKIWDEETQEKESE